MPFRNLFESLCVLLALQNVGLTQAHYVVHEKRESLHARWTKRERVPGHKFLPMRVALTQSNLDNAHNYIMTVSDPESPNYGKYWTPEQVVDAFKPSDSAVEEVRTWLVESGIGAERITHTDNKGWFAFHATSEEAERLLHTEFFEFEDSVTGGVLPACDHYHVPEHIQHHIDFISPGIKLLIPPDSPEAGGDATLQRRESRSRFLKNILSRPAENNFSKNPDDLSTCDVAITPACVAALYQIPNGTKAHPDNILGIFESELQFYYQEDLDLFFENFTSYIPPGTHPLAANIDGGQQATNNASAAGVEANLDLMLAYPIVYPQKIKNFEVDDLIVQANPNDTYTFGFNTLLDALDGSYCTFSAYGESGDDPYLDPSYPDDQPGGYEGKLMCGVFTPTNVISVSYGGQEADLPIAYQKRQCLEYLKLGLQGTSFLFASGDSGVSNYPAPYAIDGPTGCLGPDYNIFNPTWPNTCPYVTNVGATKVYPGHTVFEPESAVYDPAGHPYVTNYSSGGGFSNVYEIPSYQKNAVATFFEKYSPPYPYYSALASDPKDIKTLPNITALAGNTGGIYNRIGRGVPDVAANGDNIAIYLGGTIRSAGGTSASTPIFASVINRINEERLSIGKSPLGFLNPALYANPSMFNDITNGTNPGCDTPGFSAVPGWDPVTGLGTPNYPRMLEYFLNLP